MIATRPATWARWLQSRPQRVVTALALALAFVLCALVAYDLARDYEQDFAAASGRVGSLVQALEEHARQSMRRVELALSLAEEEVQRQYRLNKRLPPSAGTQLQRYLLQDGLIASFSVLDSQGQTLASTLGEGVGAPTSALNRAFFQERQRTSASGLFVGQAVRDGSNGLWVIPVSVRLEGGFSGYLLATVSPDYFYNLYRAIELGDNGFVSLFTKDGWAIARWPFHSEMAERNWLQSPLFKTEMARASDGVVRGKLDFSGMDTILGYRVLADFPLVLALGVSTDEALEPWHDRVLYECSGLALFLLFLGGVALALVRQLRRRQRAESALQLTEISMLRSSLPTLWVGPDARILRVNQAACELHGHSEQRMLAMGMPDLAPSMSFREWSTQWEQLRQARSMRYETTHRTQSGEDIPVEVELSFIEFEGQEYSFSFIRDLRLRKQAEQQVQRSAALLRSAIDAVDEAFVLFDPQDRLVYCNAKYIQLYPGMEDVVVPGARFEDMVRKGAERGLYRDSVGRAEEWIAERLQAHREANVVRIQQLDDGRVLRVIDRSTPEGNTVGIRVDITDMVRATEQAQQASRYKSQFLANMSHELRTPMNAILGLLALMQNTRLSAIQRDYASKAEGAAQSLLHLLNDILDFSKVEAGKMELELQPVRLDTMLHDIAVILSSYMGGKGIELLFDVDPDLPAEVHVDVLRLQQVLVNLGGNAIKFTERGQVLLQVRNRSSAEQRARSQACLAFAIQDTGIGITQDQLQHIFSGFSQAEASTTRRYGGSGLGLAISKRLVELMGGSLSVQSVPGQGSTFGFELLLDLNGGAHTAAQPPSGEAARRVLVVDDNPLARDIVARMTRSWSWPTQTAASGTEALECIIAQQVGAQFPFDLIYLDWQMPGMDGWELARQIRALCRDQRPQPRICMLSANTVDGPQRRTSQEQALVDGFLFKPALAPDLLALALGDAAPGPSRNPANLPRSSQQPLAGLRILVVEDNLINQQVAEELLNAEGALVSLAANGQLGVDAVAQSRPPFDLVLMDLQMPVLDGFDATRKIRQELQLHDLPIVAMTANAMRSDRQACLDAGMNEHVGKPFDMQHLVEVVLRVLGRAPVTAPVAAEAVQPPQASIAPADPVAAFSSPYLDLAPALERISGLSSLYVEIAGEFLKVLDLVEPSFREAVQQGLSDPAGLMPILKGQMHTLKGTSATMGAQALSGHAAALEARFKQPEPVLQPLELIPALMELVEHTRTAVVQAIALLEQVGDPVELQESMPAAAPAIAPAAVPAVAPGPMPDRARTRQFLSELGVLLQACNLDVLECFAGRGDALDALSGAQLEALQRALRGLDLALASALCRQYIETLD